MFPFWVCNSLTAETVGIPSRAAKPRSAAEASIRSDRAGSIACRSRRSTPRPGSGLRHQHTDGPAPWEQNSTSIAARSPAGRKVRRGDELLWLEPELVEGAGRQKALETVVQRVLRFERVHADDRRHPSPPERP